MTDIPWIDVLLLAALFISGVNVGLWLAKKRGSRHD